MVIYKITNLLNKKCYIGQTSQKNPMRRFYSHISNSKLNMDGYLYNAIRKYSIENFKFEVIEEVNSRDELNFLEKYYIKHYDSMNNKYGYNLTSGGGQCILTAESRLKISNTIKSQFKNGRKIVLRSILKLSEETKKKN